MKNFAVPSAGRTGGLLFLAAIILPLMASLTSAQPKYRTFNQIDLSSKKAKEGKSTGSVVAFTFRNDSLSIPVGSLHVRFNSEIRSISDSGGFTTIQPDHHNKVIDLTGRTVAPGDSVVIRATFEKKGPGTHANFWWWDTNGVRAGTKRGELASFQDDRIVIQPNGGNVRDYLYKRVIRRPAGLIVGIPFPTTGGWIQYKEADRKFFPHTDSSRCFDYVMSEHGKRVFSGRLKNPHVKKHNNHLLGELHALKLAIIANDSSVTEPLDSLTTALGDLLYNDGANPSDQFNTLTIRQIVHLADSALTYCANFLSGFYFQLDSSVRRINRAFDGPYVAESFHPLVLAGTHTLADAPFLHPNPSIAPTMRPVQHSFAGADLPDEFALRQNFPNPFNPTTTIEFAISEPSIVTLKVFNVLGQEVVTLIDKEEFESGGSSVEFDASKLTSGVYFYRIDAQGIEETGHHDHAVKRMLLVK